MPESGCFNNIQILNELLKVGKARNGVTVAFLDITKAFDTVPHKCIEASLRRKGLPEFVVRSIMESYENVVTYVGTGPAKAKIEIKRGIKQGDPISPFIFNLVFEPLLETLEELKAFRINDDASISCLAFADDLTIISETSSRAQEMLCKVEKYLESLGMTLSQNKCQTFQVVKTKESWFIKDPCLRFLNKNAVPFLDAKDSVKYLGMRISPWEGVATSYIKDALYTSCKRVQSLALKPHQKVDLITTYLVPHYLYPLAVALYPITKLREIDQMLRGFFKEIYHLPQSTADGVLYCKKRDGGLGLPKMEVIATSSALRTGQKFLDSQDPVMKSVAQEGGIEKRLKRLANAVRINWPMSLEDIEKFKIKANKDELDRWASLSSQGKAVKAFNNDKIGNCWLYNPNLLKPCRFMTALRLRANVAGDKASLSRAKLTRDINCRRCGAAKETLGHILGQCIHTKKLRIRRHNEIRDLIVSEAVAKGDGDVIIKEQNFRLDDGSVLKPDLVIQSREGVRVVDITVRHEDGDYLETGRLDKERKYSPLIPHLKSTFNVDAVEILPIVIGTRGCTPKETVDALVKLGIASRKNMKTIALMALRSSIEIYHIFMDYSNPRGSINSMR